MTAFGQDAKAAWRACLADPWTSAAVVLVMALGIGANTAIFSLVDAVLFRSLRVSNPESLVRVFSARTKGGDEFWTTSFPIYSDYSSQSDAFSALAAYREGIEIHLSAGRNPAESRTATVATGNFFDALGLRPSAGRLFSPQDDRPGASPVAVISHDLWRSRFGAAAEVVGTPVRINGLSFVIIGIGPEDFPGLDLGPPTDVWIPFSHVVQVHPAMKGQLQFRSTSPFQMVGRLRPDVSPARAQSSLESIALRLGAGQASAGGDGEPWPRVVPIAFERTKTPLRYSLLLVIAVTFALMTACLNAAGLLLVRADRQRRLTAIRLALGAPRNRLGRQMLLEGLLYGAVAGAAGALLAFWTAGLFVQIAPPELPLPVVGPRVLSARVLGITIGVSLLSCILVSLAPLHRVFRIDLVAAMNGTAPVSLPSGSRVPLRRLFVVLQVAISVVILFGAGLFLRTIRNLDAIEPGVDTDRVAVLRVDPARDGYDKKGAARLLEDLRLAVAKLPFARSAAVCTEVPPFTYRTSVGVDGQDRDVGLGIVGPGYFETLRLPLLRGRGISSTDRPGSTGVVVVNRAFIDAFWPGQDAVGKTIPGVGPKDAVVQVVGVVENARNRDLLEAPAPALYVPFSQFHDSYSWQLRAVLLVSTKIDPALAVPALRSAAASVDPNLFAEVEPLSRVLRRSFARARFLAILLSSMALLIAVIAVMGLSALISRETGARRREFAVRTVLGARPSDLRRLVNGHVLCLVGAGFAIGLPAALALGTLTSTFLFGVRPADPLTLLAVAAAVIGAGLLAALPAHRRSARRSVIGDLRSE